MFEGSSRRVHIVELANGAKRKARLLSLVPGAQQDATCRFRIWNEEEEVEDQCRDVVVREGVLEATRLRLEVRRCN